jgi:RimJ/RimL family protein N-acetyltransferase
LREHSRRKIPLSYVPNAVFAARLGFGTSVVAYLLQWCDESGCSTDWDCAKLNIGSKRIARKLGFNNERSYKLQAWFSPKREVGVK